MNNIYLIGYMGTGKSTVAKILGELTGLEVLDSDELIQSRSGMTINEIFEKLGEESFRDMETDVLRDIAAGKIGHTDSEGETSSPGDGDALKRAFIVSCGGGMPLREENRELMRISGTVVLLTASPEEIKTRILGNSDRPLLAGKSDVAYIEDMMKKRETAYKSAARLTINTEGQTPRDIAEEIAGKCL